MVRPVTVATVATVATAAKSAKTESFRADCARAKEGLAPTWKGWTSPFSLRRFLSFRQSRLSWHGQKWSPQLRSSHDDQAISF